MVSIRTQYRQKRIELIKEYINLLVNILTLEKKELEKIPLPFLKKMKESLMEKFS